MRRPQPEGQPVSLLFQIKREEMRPRGRVFIVGRHGCSFSNTKFYQAIRTLNQILPAHSIESVHYPE
ncbi:MAG: hypothetical protein ABS79_02570 [Planctomycetes bacterium SCN 63-9]|nr:MAG: hypothetical protein ABS79_02570 [Planctomycetes bacterium SCN 63-9]